MEGQFDQIHKIQSFVPGDTVDKTVFGKVQRHRLTHLQWHLKHTAEVAYRLQNQLSFDGVMLMVESRIAAMLDEFLHESLKQNIIHWIYNSPDADSRDRKKLIESVLSDYHAEKEADAVEELSKLRPEAVVSSLGDVVEACNLFVVRRLLARENLERKGFVCKAHHYASLEPGKCPFDGAKLLPVANIVDEIVEIGRRHGVSVLILQQRPELLAKYGGIAAVRYVVPQLGAEEEAERARGQSA